VFHQEIGDDLADLGREEAAAILRHISAALDRADDARIGARPANPFLLQCLHQRRFAEARRRLGEVLALEQVEAIEHVPLLHGRKFHVLLLADRLEHSAVAIELHDPSIGAEEAAARRYFDRRYGHDRRRTLAGHETLPDQFVEPVLVPGEVFQPVGGPKAVRYSQAVKFAGLPQLGQNTPKGYAVWLVTHMDKTGAQMRWNFYWVDADIARSLATIAGEVRLHTQLLDGDGTLLTEEELPLFLTDVHEQYRPGGLQRESGFKSGYWMLCSYTRRKYEVDREKRETISLFIAPLVTQLDAGLPGLALQR